MEKLIELLNKYLFEIGRKTIIERYDNYYNQHCGTFHGIVEGEKDYPNTFIWGLEIISKEFGFIKWLVENDKIDVEKIEKRNLIPIDASLRHKVEDEERNNVNRLWETKILMLLSISDSPIDDLISYLK